MNLNLLALLAALATVLPLGLAVFFANSRRTTNQHFCTLSFFIAAWLLSFGTVLVSDSANAAERGIRLASISCLFVPIGFDFLRRSIIFTHATYWSVIKDSRKWFYLLAFLAALCLSDFFLVETYLPETDVGNNSVPEAVYGPGFLIFNIGFMAACLYVIVRYVRDAVRVTGASRIELQYVLLGWAACSVIGIGFALLIPAVSGSTQSAQFAPLCVIPLNLSIAYGIATQRIMDVAHVLRRVLAYAVLALYLSALYVLVWWGLDIGLHALVPDIGNWLPHLVAALAVAFSMAPMQGRFQRFANKLFGSRKELDIQAVISNVNALIQSIDTLPNLLQHFSETVGAAVGTDQVAIYLRNGNGFALSHTASTERQGLPDQLEPQDVLVQEAGQTRDALVVDEIKRRRPTPRSEALRRRLNSLDAQVLVAIRSPHQLEGLMLLGSRLSGRIYTAEEANALPLLSEQLAVGLENAALYTETRDSKIYNEVLLDNLASGVVAVNSEREISVMNREALRITGFESRAIVGQPLADLPQQLRQSLEETLRTGRGLRDIDATLPGPDGEEIPVRIATSAFTGHTGESLGALLVFSDLTQIRKLETQLRRNDRLASIGTLAAGMAHEIKNPLVTVKTFAQLLPERYEDDDFRTTFSELIGHEVRRIDGIVNQLLNFSRPNKPNLEPTPLHEIIEQCMKLSAQQLKNKGIVTHLDLGAEMDMILADANLLQQALINFILNATEAMNSGGDLYVTTESVADPHRRGSTWPPAEGAPELRLVVRDTGQGIPPDDMTSIFDPFFTTKGQGTGLGLSVAHGIIAEHDGRIDVESEVGRGTAFVITFPLLHREAAA